MQSKAHGKHNQTHMALVTIRTVITDMVDSAVEKRPWDVERLLGADVPITSDVLAVDEDQAFAPAL